jgi:hypothetical protein
LTHVKYLSINEEMTGDMKVSENIYGILEGDNNASKCV